MNGDLLHTFRMRDVRLALRVVGRETNNGSKVLSVVGVLADKLLRCVRVPNIAHANCSLTLSNRHSRETRIPF
jgi:hypothetical protein